MTIDERIRSEIKDDMSIIERIKMYIPGYGGYRERNVARDADRAVRKEVSIAIQGTKADLATIQRELIGRPELMMDVERIRTKVDRYDVSIQKAVNGYSGFRDTVKIEEEELNALMRWDAQLIEDIRLMRQATADLLESVDEGRESKAEVRNLERGIDGLMENYNRRESVMKGFADTEE